MGQISVAFPDSKGNIVYSGKRTNVKSGGRAFAEAFTAQTIENQSELVGEYFAPLQDFIQKGAIKALDKWGLSKTKDFLTGINNKQIMKSFNRFTKNTEWNGLFGEVGEEIVGNFENAFTVGDLNLNLDINDDNSVFSKKVNTDIILGVGLGCGIISGARVGSYIRNNRKLNTAINDADTHADVIFGTDRWQQIKSEIDNAPDDKAGNLLQSYINNAKLNNEQKQTIVDYTVNTYIKRGNDISHLKNAIEDNISSEQQEVQSAYENGQNARDAQMNEVKTSLDEAEKHAAELLGEDELNALDGVEDVDAFKESNAYKSYSEEQREAALKYIIARTAYNGMINRVQDEIKAAVNKTNAEIDNLTHKDSGTIIRATLKNGDQEVYVVSGNVVTSPDGKSIDTEKSDNDIVVYNTESGKKEMLNIKDLQSVDTPIDAATYKANNAAETTQQIAETEAAKIDGTRSFHYNDTVKVQDKEGNLIDGSVQDVTPDGVIVVSDAYPGGKTYTAAELTAMQPQPQTVAENATVEQQAEEAVADNESNEAPAEEKGEANSPQSEATPQEETAEPQQQAVEPQQQAIPTDDKGNLLYHEVPVERTIEDLYDGSLDDTEIADFISANIEAAQKEYNSVVKKAPKISTDKAKYLQEKQAYQEEVGKAKAKVDYWQAVENERQRITHTSPEELKNAEDELSGEAARKDYRGITAGDEENPTSVEDLVRDFLRGAKITPEDFRKETGLSISEQKKFVGMISKQGKTIARLGEELADYDAMNLGGRFFDGDSNAARGAIIDALLSSRTRGDFKEQDATAEEERYIEAVEQQREQWYYENYHMTYEEYLQYREIVLPELLRKYANFAPDILYPQFVASFEDAYAAEHSQTDNIENGEQGNDTTTEEPTTTPGDTVLQTEETNNSRGDSQSEEQPTEVPTGVRSSNENGTLPQSTPTEVDKEPLSEEAAQSLITSMEENAIEDPEIRLTPQTWLETFGINNSIDTPIGKVRMGENQYAKLQDKKRTSEFGMISLTLSDPDVIFVEPSKAKGEDVAERNFSYVFAKTFKRNGNKVKYYTSVTVSIDGLEISVSSHFVNPNKMLNKLMEFNREYTKETLFSNSSEMRLAEHQSDVPDLLPTQENNVSSDSKVTQSSQTKQEKENKFSPTPRKDGESITDYAERVAEEHKAQRTRKEEEAKVDTNPTDAQKEAGNYKKGHIKVDGLNITIEQPKGSIRRGTDANGKQWESEMHNTYGYIRGTESVDGDHIDIFLSDNPTEGNVFVVDQINKDGSFDEHKVMYGFSDMESARQAYLSNYEEDWQGLGNITEVSKEDFKAWIDSSKRKTKPFTEYTSAKTQDDTQTKKPTEENAAPANTETNENYAHNSEEIMHEQKNVQLQQAINAYENATKFYYQQLKEGKLDKVFESKQWKDVLRKQTELQKALLQLNSEELKELLKQTTNEDTKKEIKGALDAVLRQEQRSIEYNAVLDKQEPITPIYKEEKKSIAVTEFVETDKKEAEIHPVLTGVYHDNGYVVGTNAHTLLARKEDYNKSLEGKITNKKGEFIDGKYPNWRAVVEGETTTNSWGINLDELHAFVRGVLAKLKSDGAKKSTIDSATIAFKDTDGKIIVCNAKTLDKALRGAKSIGATEFGNKSETFAHAQTKKGYVVCPTISTYHSINDNCFVYAPKEAARQQTTATLTNDTEAKQKATEAVLAALSKAGIEVVRATDEQAQELLANTHATSLRTPQGTIYGWSVNGKIYLTEAGINPDTPIHEYTHLWAEAMMIKNKKGWDSIKALLKDNPIWNEVVADANYSNIADNEDAVASEVLSRISGRKNAAKMEEEAQRAIDEAKGVFEKARATTILTNLKKALNSLWKWVSKNIFDVKEFSSINEVTDKVLYDLIHGTKLINDKSLIGVHNISEQKLRKVLKQGGFANPSIAVIDTDKQVHNDYGEISLILPSRKVNKSTGKNVGTYEGDAWTPMYPIIEKQMSNDGNLIMHNDINSVPNEMQSEVRNALNRWLDNGSDTDLSYLYLFQQGKAPKMATVKPKYSNEVYKSLRDIMFGVDSVYNLTKGEVKKLVELYVQTELNGDIDEYNKANERRITKYKETIESGRTNSMYYKIAERNLEEVKKYGYPLSSLKTFADDVQRDKTKQGSKNVQKTLNAASQIIKDAGLEEDFRNWVEGLNNRYQTKEVIFDGFTPTGKRRYIPNTLENVSKLMKKQGRQASTGLGVSFSNFAASVMKANGSLANIRKKKSKLTNEHKDIENFEEKWKEVYFDLAMKLQPNASTFDDYGFTRLQEAALEADPQAFLSKEYGVTLSKEDVRKLQQMVKAIQEERPAMYFETKFERPVTLNEFSKAVVPEDLSDDLQKTLRDNGIEIFTYKRGDAEDRQKATQEAAYSSDDIAFQIISNGNNEANNDSDTRFQIVGNSLSDEEKKIVETTKANDTYMKAPNGKPTNLSEKQWAQVRTTAFKNWFGDWEKAARIEKVRRSKAVVISGSEYKDKYELNRDSAKEWIKDNLRGEYTIADTEEIVSLTKVGANKVTSHGMSNKAHLQSIAAIPQLIRNAIFIEERPNEKHNNKYDSYKYYICGLKIGTTDYTVKLTIGVKSGKKYYDHALTEIEKGKLLDRINDQADKKGFTTTGDAPLQSYALSIGKDSKLLSILQTNSSKVVDENGEPMVVYHGSNNEFTKFDTARIGSSTGTSDGRGFYFTTDKDYAYSFGKGGNVLSVFLNIDNPLSLKEKTITKRQLFDIIKRIDEKEVAADGEHWFISNYANYYDVGIDGAIREAAESEYPYSDNDVELVNSLISASGNFKDVVNSVYEITGKSSEIVPKENGTVHYVVTNPNQIKSATGNNGNFSTTEDDILYRTVFGGNSGYVGYSMSKRAAEAKEEDRGTNTEPTADIETLTNHAESIVQNLHLNNVEIVPDGSSLNGEQATAKGFYNKRTGKIVVVAGNHTDIADIEKTVLHEAVAHHGLRELFGDNFDNFLDTVFAKADIETRQQIAHLSAKHGWNVRTATEEYLASMAEDTNFEQIKPTLWQRIKQLFGEIMSAFGLHHAKLTDNDLRYILWRSYKNLQNSGKHSILDKAEDIAMQYRLKAGNYTDKFTDELNAVNERFNEELSNLTEENADKVTLWLGKPSKVLLAAGVEDKPMKLYGNKVIRKMKKHGFSLEELRDLPRAVADPVAVFNNYQREGNRSILTELKTQQGNFLVSVNIGKDADINFNIVRSVFGKGNENVVAWINNGLATYINKEKALSFLFHQSAPIAATAANAGQESSSYLHLSAPIAEAAENSELSSAAKIIKDFHNPKLNSNVLYRSSIDPTATEVLPDARTRYEEETKEPDNIGSVPKTHNFFRRFYKSYVDSMLALKSFTNSVLEATDDKMASHEDTYKAENAMTSKNKTDGEVYNRDYYNPLLTAAQQLCEAVGMDYDALNMYMVAKHGLERNEYMGKRAAQNDENVLKAKKTLEDAQAAYNEDSTSKNEAAIQKAQEKYSKVYDKALEVHTNKDYSGLTELTDKEDVAEAEYEAQKIVDAVETSDVMPKVTAFWSKVNAATKQTLKTGYESGIMTKDTYEHILNMYKYYIPLRGWAKPTADDVYTYYNNRSYEGKPLTKTAKGRTSLAEDPMAIIASMAQRSIIEANRNKMKQTFLNFVLNHPTSLATVGEQWYIKNALGEWERSDANIPANATPDEISKLVAEHEQEMQTLAETGEAIKQRNGLKLDKRVINGEGAEHTIKVWRGGKEYIIYINGNPAVAQAVNGLTNPDTQGSDLPKWAKIGAAQLKNFLSGVYTSFSPAFVLTNFTRDQLFASQAVYIKYGLKYKRQASKNARNLFFSGALPRLVYKWEHGTLDLNNETERYFDEFMRGGGETGFTALRDIESIKKEIKDAINGNKVNIAKRGWKSFINAVEFANRSAEDFSRFVTFMTSRQQGKNIVDSIYDAKDITVNFNKKGSGEMGSRFMNFAYIFFNAAVQSINNFGTMLKQHPARTMLIISKFGALGFGVPMLNAFLTALCGGGDDDKYWDNMDWVRRNNIVLRIPFLEKTFISIPLPQELRPFYGMGEIAASILFGKETFSSGLQKAVEGFTGLLPIDFTGNGGNLSITLTPTVLQPVAQYMFNTDYFGRKVYNDNENKKFAPGWTKAFSSTPPALIGATKFLNSLTGGNDVDKGAVSLNPDVINHFVKGYFGGPATFVTQMSSLLYKGFSGDAKEIRWRDIPVASRFVQQLDERSVRSSAQGSYKDFKEETEETEYRLSNYKKQVKMGKMEYAKMITDLIKSPEYQRYKIAKAYKKPMDLLQETLNHIDNTTDKKEVEKALTGLRHYMMETVESEQKGKHAKREEDFNYLGDNLSELNNNLNYSLRSLKRNEEQRLDGEEDDGIEELISEDKETTMRIIREMNKLFKKK